MPLLLEECDTWDIVQRKEAKPPIENAVLHKSYYDRYKKAARIIVISIEESLQSIVYGLTDPRVTWQKLRDAFVPKPRLRRLQTYRALATARPNESEDMQDYVNRVRQLVIEAEEAGNQKATGETVTTILLAGLPERFSGVVKMTEAFPDGEYNSQRIETLIVGEARRQRHVVDEARINGNGHAKVEEAMYVKKS